MLDDLIGKLNQAVQESEQRRADEQQNMQRLAAQTMMTPTGGLPTNNGPARPSNGGPPVGGKGPFSAFMRAISDQESGGNYGAMGVQTKSGRALGRYQVLDSNINGPGGWDMEALGHNITPQQYLHSPRLQDAIVRYKLQQYFKQYGASGAAKAWYAGPGNAMKNSNAPQYGGPSINAYAASVLKHMRNYL